MNRMSARLLNGIETEAKGFDCEGGSTLCQFTPLISTGGLKAKCESNSRPSETACRLISREKEGK